MNNFLRMCLNIITQIGPYLVVLLLLKYLVNLQQKRAKEREEEQKKGIIRTHYIIKTEKVLTMFFVLAVFLFGGATVASAIQQDDLLPPIGFSIFFIVSLIGSLNMIMWKLEVNGDEITWRSTFGRKRTFHFEDITYCERKKGSMRVYVNGEKLFTIDSNIDKEEFMEDIKRRRIPVKSYWANQHKKNYIEYLLDILLYGSLEERKALVAEQRKEVLKLEQRIAELSADRTMHSRRNPKQLRAERER